MANRTSGQVRGDIGEMEVIKMLLRLGLVINSLTQSDAGWDLHAQLPMTPMVDAETRSSKESWGMSGRTCHIQVKNAVKPDLTMRTVRGWISGVSTGGPPTFLFVKNRGHWTYATPQTLKQWVGQFAGESSDAKIRPGATKRNKKMVDKLETHRYDDRAFGMLLHLWAFFPAMSMQGSLDWVHDVIDRDQDARQHAMESFALKIAFGLWFHHKPAWEEIASSSSNEVLDLSRLLSATGISNSADTDDVQAYAHRLIGEEIHEYIGFDEGWHDPIEQSAQYTSAPHHPQRLEDAIAMVKNIANLLLTSQTKRSA